VTAVIRRLSVQLASSAQQRFYVPRAV